MIEPSQVKKMSNSQIQNVPDIIRDDWLKSHKIKPFGIAIIVSGIYFLFSIIYIYVSTQFAASSVLSKEQLEQIELYKGFLFVLVTAVFLFFVLFFLFKRLNRKEQDIEKQRNTIVAASNQAAAGLFASSIAHDLNNILTVSQFSIDQLSESQELSPAHKKHVERLVQTNNQIRDFTRRLSDVSGRHLSSGIHKIDVVSAIAAAINLASTHKKMKRCSIERDLPAKCFAVFDESILHRALLNLLLNAADANKGRGKVFVKLSEDEETIKIEVHDEGPGISPEEKNRILEPFYTTKSDGSGLGLLSVRYCTEIHNGTLNIEKSHLGGACICMVMPRKTTMREGKS